MIYPNRFQEKKLSLAGFKYIAGLDEAGRGAWAGPLVAAAVILNPKIRIPGIKDSKLLRAPIREKLFQKITTQALAWGIGIITNEEIDQLGLTQANIKAMQQALANLKIQPDYFLSDALKIEYRGLPTKAIIDGDYKVTSIAAASIVAKVARDKIMDEFDEKYPAYGFKHHKGYGTNHHFHMINQYGICTLHRQSFEPIKHFTNL